MGLKDDAEKELAHSKKCVLGKILAGDDKEFANDVLDLLNDERISNTLLMNLLKKHGHRVSDVVIGRHKKRNCICVYS